MLTYAPGLLALSIIGGAFIALTPRRGEPKLTVTQRLIRAVYRVSAWLWNVAVGMDRGYKAYREGLATVQISPENEA